MASKNNKNPVQGKNIPPVNKPVNTITTPSGFASGVRKIEVFIAGKVESKKHYLFLGILTIIYVVMLIIVNPIGNFPLNDDWFYGHALLSLLSGTRPNIAIQMTLIAQLYWGWLFCLFSGFSFTALRISTLVIGLAGVLILYFISYNLSGSKRFSFLVALLLLVNPLYFSLANTFMTDVPFISFALFSLYFFIKYIDTRKRFFIILAILFTVIATLIRQFGIITALSYAIIFSLRARQTIKQRLIHFIPFLIVFFILKIVTVWLTHIGISSNAYGGDATIFNFFNDPNYWTSEILKRLGNILFYFGLLFFPVLLFIGVNLKSLKSNYISIVFLLCVATALIIFYREFPNGNCLRFGYVGTKSICFNQRYTNTDSLDSNPFSNNITVLTYMIGTSGAILLLINLRAIIIKIGNKLIKTMSITDDIGKYSFIALCTLGFAASLFIILRQFDRYLIPLFPFLCLTIISEPLTKRKVSLPVYLFMILFVLIIGLFSSLSTHDYLAWNRARWQAVDYLTKDQTVSMHNIDAGYEVNGWFLGFDGRKINFHLPEFGIMDGNDYKLSYWGEEADYDYRTLKKFPYTYYISSPHQRFIYAMHSRVVEFNNALNLLKEGKTDSAEIIIKGFKEEAQKYTVPRLHIFLGILYEKKNMLNEAEQEFENEITLHLSKEEAYFNLGMLYLQMKDYDKSIHAWECVIAINPKKSDAYDNLGVCYINSGKDTKKAQELFAKAVELNPDFIQAYINFLISAQKNKDEESFIKYAKILISKGIGINDMKAKGINIPEDFMKKISSG